MGAAGRGREAVPGSEAGRRIGLAAVESAGKRDDKRGGAPDPQDGSGAPCIVNARAGAVWARYGRSMMASISMFDPSGSAATWMVERAGKGAVKNSP